MCGGSYSGALAGQGNRKSDAQSFLAELGLRLPALQELLLPLLHRDLAERIGVSFGGGDLVCLDLDRRIDRRPSFCATEGYPVGWTGKVHRTVVVDTRARHNPRVHRRTRYICHGRLLNLGSAGC